MDELNIDYINMVDHPEGRLVQDGKIRLLGFSEPPAEGLSPPCIAGTGPMLMELDRRLIVDEATGEERLEPRRYSWCSCGYSKNQPWCDNQHREEEHATNRRSYKMEVLAPCSVAICMCKHTKTPPFCDGSHDVVCSRVTELEQP